LSISVHMLPTTSPSSNPNLPSNQFWIVSHSYIHMSC
jgi:hypothetical protein